jgi:putative membrane protein
MDNAEPLQIPSSQDLSEKQWQRLSPIAIVYFAVGFVRAVFGNFVYLLPALAFSYTSLRENPFIWLPAIVLLISLMFVAAVWSFKVYRFRFSDNNVEIRSGIFSKKQLNLPFERIQNVKLEQPVYYRLTGFACLQLDTAGSAKQEAKLVALPLALAEQLKQLILSYKSDQPPTTQHKVESQHTDENLGSVSKQTQEQQVEHEQLLNRRSLGDLVIHGITSNRIWIILGGLAPFYDRLADKLSQVVAGLGIDFKELFNLETHAAWQVGLYAMSLTMLVMLVMLSFSIIGSIVSFYGYTLSKSGNRYIRRSGLLTKHEVSMPLSRLQLVIQKQDWLDLVLKRINLKLEQSNAHLSQVDTSATNSKIVVPSVTPMQSKTLIDDLFPDNQLFSIAFMPISGFYLVRNIGYILLPLFVLLESFALYHHNIKLAAILLGLFAVMSTQFYLRWRRWGVAFDEKYVYLRRGIIGTDYYCFPAYKVQQSQFKQSVMMKKRQLASVKLILASGSVTAPLLPEKMALKLINQCLYKVEASQISWM